MMKMQNFHIPVVIIGAGLTGLATAHFLKKEGIPFLVLEKNNHPGGVIKTFNEKGFIYETGPNTGVLGSSEIVELFEDLKGLCELETASNKAKKRFILKNGKWEPLPSGILSGIKTPLFTTRDKLRILGEPFRKKGRNPDENLSGMVKRRLGQSFLEYAIDPFIIGVYAGDPEVLIPKYALPKLYNLEQTYGSFIGGAIKKQFQKKTEAEKKINRKVFSAKGGLSNLVDAIIESCGENSFHFAVKNLKVSTLNDKNKTSDGPWNRFKVSYDHKDSHKSISTGHVIYTGGSFELNPVFPFIPHAELEKLNKLQYARVVEVTIGFNQWKGIPLDGFGGLIPSKEKRDILGVLYMSTLFEGRAPDDGALLTVFMGGIRKPEIADLSDDGIFDIVAREVTDLMQLTAFKPDLFRVARYDHAIPQYDISSGQRFMAISDIEKRFPGLLLGGNMRDGIGMADRVRQGKLLARETTKNLTHE